MEEAKALRAARFRFARLFLAAVFIAGAAHAGQHAAPDSIHRADLVEITRLDSSIRLDIRYATPNNFTGRAVYAMARAFLQRPAALALLRAHNKLRERGYGLVIFDGYRPWSITKVFWEITLPSKHKFVADPATGSRHNRGCAVDCTLADLATGAEIGMTSPYDDFTEKAAARYPGGTPAQRQARDILRSAMEREGFSVNPDEWWHFDYKDWAQYPVLNIPFDRIP